MRRCRLLQQRRDGGGEGKGGEGGGGQGWAQERRRLHEGLLGAFGLVTQPDLVAHLEVGPARRRVWLDLGDDVAVVEVAPHLLEQVGPSIGARRAHEIASVWGCGRALKLPAFCSARFIRTCTVSFCAPYGLPEMAGLVGQETAREAAGVRVSVLLRLSAREL